MSKETKLDDLLSVLKSIEIILEDSNQNFKDCKRELKVIKKELFPQKQSWIEKLLRRKKA